MSDNHPLLDLLIELQTLDRVPRMGYALRGVADPESVSEHTFHLVFMVWSLAAEEPRLDRLRAIELALVHDLVEVRTGDLPRTAAGSFEGGAKARAERVIAAALLAPLGERAGALVHEYQEAETAEARFVKACDKLQVRVKALAYEGWGAQGLDDFWDGLEPEVVGRGFASLERLARALLERRAKR